MIDDYFDFQNGLIYEILSDGFESKYILLDLEEQVFY